MLDFYNMAMEFEMGRYLVPRLLTRGFVERMGARAPEDWFTVPRPWPDLGVLITEKICQTYLLENGMQQGDRILAIDGDRIDTFEDVVSHVILYPGRKISIQVERGGRELPIAVTIPKVSSTDRFGNTIERGQIGISARLSFERVGPGTALAQGWDQTIGVMKFMVAGLRQIVVGERSVRELGGPIKIAKFSGESLAMGWPAFVSFAALISINLAFINLLPIPGLDGGHLAIYAAETIRRKPLDARSQEWAFRTGLALVLALMLFVTLNDIASLPIFGR
mgnify:CR=1 FL=1